MRQNASLRFPVVARENERVRVVDHSVVTK